MCTKLKSNILTKMLGKMSIYSDRRGETAKLKANIDKKCSIRDEICLFILTGVEKMRLSWIDYVLFFILQ